MIYVYGIKLIELCMRRSKAKSVFINQGVKSALLIGQHCSLKLIIPLFIDQIQSH